MERLKELMAKASAIMTDLDGLQGFISNKQRHAIDYMHEKFFPGGLGDEVSEYFMSLENPRTRRRMDDASPNDEIRQGLDYIVSYPEDPEIQDIYKILTEAYVRKSLMPYIDNGEITYVSDIVISPVFPGREKVRAGIIIAFPDDASSSIYKNIANTLGAKIYNNGLEINTSNY